MPWPGPWLRFSEAATNGRRARERKRSDPAVRSSRPIQPSKEFPMQSFHDFEMTSITGEPVKLSRYDGQVCLVVNLASE